MSCNPLDTDFDLVRGDTLVIPMEFQTEEGVAVDQTGCTFTGEITETEDQFTFDTSEEEDGIVSGSVVHTVTAGFSSEVLYLHYKIHRVDATGIHLTVMRGRINL